MLTALGVLSKPYVTFLKPLNTLASNILFDMKLHVLTFKSTNGKGFLRPF